MSKKAIEVQPDPTDERPDQWSIVANEDIGELWGEYRRGGRRHAHRFVYPCLDRTHAVDLLRALLETRKLYALRKAQSQYALNPTSTQNLTKARQTLGRAEPLTVAEMAAFARSWDAKVEEGRA